MQKSKVLICKRLGHNLMSEVWFYGDQLLDICDEYTYLGITFTTGGITNRSINILTSQAKKALASMCNELGVCEGLGGQYHTMTNKTQSLKI